LKQAVFTSAVLQILILLVLKWFLVELRNQRIRLLSMRCISIRMRLKQKLGTELQWNRGDDIKSSKVFIQIDNVSIENEEDWPQMAKFHADWSKKFYDVIVPYIALGG